MYVCVQMSVNTMQCTFGQQLLSAKYSKNITPRTVLVWALLSVGCPYIKHRATDLARLFTRGPPIEQVHIMYNSVNK